MVTALQMKRWTRALALAKLLFDDEGYFTSYLDQIEGFIKEKANESEESKQSERFNKEEAKFVNWQLTDKHIGFCPQMGCNHLSAT